MNYINTTTGEYPVTESMVRLAYPNTSFPVPFQAPEEYALVFPAPQPAYDPITQRVQAIAPELTALGHWEQRWEVVELFDTQTEKDEAIAADRAAKQAAAWERIKVHRDYLSENGGYKVSIEGVDKWFHSDAKSKTQQLSLVLLSANASAVPPWKTMDGSKVTMSQTLAGQIFAAAVTQDGALFAAAEVHRVAMETSNTPESYDFSDGWPTVFVE